MEATNTEIKLNQQTETQTQKDTNKQEKLKLSLDNLKTPSASDAFKARVTCQRRS
jgi:hypothetical protein